jgi:hypothetical protein
MPMNIGDLLVMIKNKRYLMEWWEWYEWRAKYCLKSSFSTISIVTNSIFIFIAIITLYHYYFGNINKLDINIINNASFIISIWMFMVAMFIDVLFNLLLFILSFNKFTRKIANKIYRYKEQIVIDKYKKEVDGKLSKIELSIKRMNVKTKNNKK